MPPLRQHALTLLLSFYVGLVLNLPGLWRSGSAGGWLAVATALLAAVTTVSLSYVWFGLCGLLGKFFYKVLASLSLLISAAASYYMIFFQVVVGYGVVASTLTLDTDLSFESIGYQGLLWLLLCGLLPVGLLWAVPLVGSPKQGLRRFGAAAWRGAAALALLVLSVQGVNQLHQAQTPGKHQYAASIRGMLAHSYLPSNWISGLATHVYQLLGEARADQVLFDPAAHFDYQAPASADDLIVVFVIGETTRWDHMGLLGYARDTTPLLAQEPNLVALAGTSCDTATKLSLRCMFVRPGGSSDNAQRSVSERNVFSVLRSLGFSSELYALQSEAWFYNSVDANHYEVREALASIYGPRQQRLDDMVLVDQLRQSLAKNPKGKRLVILHTKGSHYLYSQRYPQEFARFQPECLGIDRGCSREELVNAFDNSIGYVDYMLKSTLDALRDKNAIVFFTSDHGESIGDGISFHATPKEVAPPEQFRVPFIVWASDRFLQPQHNQRAFAKLRALQSAGFTPHHQQLFDSVLGCIGYRSSNGGIQPAHNWCDLP